jgi:hypothetical protein
MSKFAAGPTGIYNVRTGEVVPNTAPPAHGSEMAQVKRDLDFDRNVEALSKRLENVPSMRADLQKLLSYAQLPSIPGVGRVAGRLPASFQGDDAIRVRQAARGVVGTLIKEQSGMAASESEVSRKLEELGLGPGATEDEFKLGLVRLVQNMGETVRGKESGYSPDVVETARKRGLVTSADLPVYGSDNPNAAKEQTPSAPVGALTIYRMDGTRFEAPNEEVKAKALASKRYKAAP